MQGRIVLVSGASGSGKSSISKILAANSTYPHAVRMHTDDFYGYVAKGYIPPWENESGAQNETIIQAVAAAAKRFAEGGYEVFVDGVIGPWFLQPWLRLAGEGFDVRYIVLRPTEQETINRAMDRNQRAEFPMDAAVISSVWKCFADLGDYEKHVLDTTDQSMDESIAYIQQHLTEADFCRL